MAVESVAVDRLTLLLGYLVVGVWVLSTAASFIDRSYNPPPELHVALIALVSALFGKKFIDRANGRKGDQS